MTEKASNKRHFCYWPGLEDFSHAVRMHHKQFTSWSLSKTEYEHLCIVSQSVVEEYTRTHGLHPDEVPCTFPAFITGDALDALWTGLYGRMKGNLVTFYLLQRTPEAMAALDATALKHAGRPFKEVMHLVPDKFFDKFPQVIHTVPHGVFARKEVRVLMESMRNMAQKVAYSLYVSTVFDFAPARAGKGGQVDWIAF